MNVTFSYVRFLSPRFVFPSGVVQSKTQRLKISKIAKIRDEAFVGISLTRILYIAQKGHQIYVHTQARSSRIPQNTNFTDNVELRGGGKHFPFKSSSEE